ncbi:PREDICTED: 26S proteasome non-ATPase regulatory subunit 13-like [Priapulus caudatus]|uniref:26S proteasome non-ATPase regulatory subunit 13 n=1 Tax=Priapulus caudatus TaxID=37621 RepID=A0ABM1DPF9_PRICU|nr:PREDICTED: 26S proteasome non-ATPase regulatory subunit 13-like [Priapulus caudatus]
MRDVTGYLAEQQRTSCGELAAEWSKLEELYNKKLWHQLTVKVMAFVKNTEFTAKTDLMKLYENFLADFEHRINLLSFVEIIIYVVRQIPDPKACLEFMAKVQEKVKTSDQAQVLCLTVTATISLQLQDLPTTKDLIEKAEKLLGEQDGVTTVHSRFYDLCSNYYKTVGNHAKYYRDTLRFLGCMDLTEMSEPEKQDRAFHLGLAAILGDGVYNFGELLAHPILDALKGTEKQWLVDMLFAFNSGNIAKYESLRPYWTKQPDLAAHELAMRQKISLLCLMEMTFKRPANNRQLTFEQIAGETRLPVNEVELLVMKALSLGLVKGSIDETEQKVHMTWVQPRVLDLQQIASMQERLTEWCVAVKSMEMLLENKAGDILTL